MTKILATIGPASEDDYSLSAISKHTKLFRLNGSHNEIEWHEKTINKIRNSCPDAFILLDIPGIKPRTNNHENIRILENQEVLFGSPFSDNDFLNIELTKPLPKYNKDLKTFTINDGQHLFDIIEYGEKFIIGKSRSEFMLPPRKGLNLSNSIYDENEQLNTFLKFIEKVKTLDVNGFGLSFVQTGDIIEKVREIVPNLVLISKIENSEGLRNYSDIIYSSDAIMIDRGDLGAEIGLINLYNAIELISSETKNAGKPLIMATENLESMINREMPSKSDVMSIVHSISIGSDVIMLSEETATAKNGLKIVSWLNNFITELNPIGEKKSKNKSTIQTGELWKLVAQIEDIPVLIVTKLGYALFEYIAIKPKAPVIIVTNNKKLINTAKLFSNEITVIEYDLNANTPIEIV
ncbi:pyruvate kinase, partial [Alphaproteobacteria bacterium]|nr:pyruvate kinase [Alphaproteobacteria bacterium]